MKTMKILCPDCKREILIGIPEKDDGVNGIQFDAKEDEKDTERDIKNTLPLDQEHINQFLSTLFITWSGLNENIYL